MSDQQPPGHHLSGTWAARGLPPIVRNTLSQHGARRTVRAGEMVYECGARAERLYVVESGELDVLTSTTHGTATWMATVGPGGWFGMAAAAAALRERPDLVYTETIVAREPTTVLSCTTPQLTELWETPNFRSALELLVIRRLYRLAGPFASLFGELTLDPLLSAQQAFEHVAIGSGEILFRRGDPADGVYVVESGRMEVLIGEPGDYRVVAELGPGQVIGEIAYFTGAPRSATVRARRDTFLLRSSESAFERVLDLHPRVAISLARLLAQRLSPGTASAPAAPAGRVFSVITPDGERFQGLVKAIARQMSPPAVVKTVEHLRKKVGTLPENLSELRRRFRAWLDAAEERHTHILLHLSERWDRWTQLCLPQSDHHVRIVDPTAPVEPIQAERESALHDLVLLHPHGTRRARDTGRWLDPRPPNVRHHHVANGDIDDVRRVSRFLSGRAVGLALGGGAARCFVHVGVLTGLSELGITIDAVTGTSSGSHVAAALAAGFPVGEIATRLRRAMVEQNPLGRATFPVVALRDTRSTFRIAEEVCEGRAIEDLWLPFRCVSTDLTAGAARFHTRGDLARALVASGALPVLMPPVLEDGHVLCDGGLLDNLPVAPLRRLGASPIIACTVSSAAGVRAEEGLQVVPSGLSMLLRRLSPFHTAPKIPNIFAMAFQSVTCTGALQGRDPDSRPDLLLSPDVTGFGAADFDKHAQMVDVGRRYVLEHAAQLKELIGAE